MVYSTCIPRVFYNIRESRIRGVFRSLNIGEIERIDMVKKMSGGGKQKGKNFWCVFIHWSRLSEEVKSALDKNESVTIVYDDPWFWNMTKSKAKMPTRRPAPRLKIGSAENSSNPAGAQAPGSPDDGSWVDAADALPAAPQTPPSKGTPPSPPPLVRQKSVKMTAVGESVDRDAEEGEGDTAADYDKSLQPDACED